VLPAAPSPYLVPFDGRFDLASAPTAPPPDGLTGKAAKEALEEERDTLADLQRLLWADRNRALLVLFQARDAAGKDSTIRHVFRGVNPAGVRVTSYGVPTEREREHDYLWRHMLDLPRRGTIGVHNRSWYEEVLVVRVHPGILEGQRQRLPEHDPQAFWDQRLRSIREVEAHLARNGTAIVKLFLNVGANEQARRLLRRLDRHDKHWKYNPGDLDARARWAEYDVAYQQALAGTSRQHAPWYAIPADDKRYMRLTVARLLVRTLKDMDLAWPQAAPDDAAVFEAHRQALRAQLEAGSTR